MTNTTQVVKEATTIWLHNHDVLERYYRKHILTNADIRLIIKITKKFIKTLENGDDFTPLNTGMKMSEHFNSILDTSEPKGSVWITRLNQYLHMVMKHRKQIDYDKLFHKRPRYEKQILERLMR